MAAGWSQPHPQRATARGAVVEHAADRMGVQRGLEMKQLLVALVLLMAAATGAQIKRDYPVKPVPFTAVHVHDVFWAPRIETNRAVTIPFAFKKDEETGRMDNFIRAAKALRGEPFENHKYPP